MRTNKEILTKIGFMIKIKEQTIKDLEKQIATIEQKRKRIETRVECDVLEELKKWCLE